MDLTLLKPILKKYSIVKGSLVSVLQSAQDLYGYLPKEVIIKIAKELGEPVAKVEGVASFYTQFRFKPVGKFVIMLCQGTACHVNGSGRLFDFLSEKLGVLDGETTPDGLFTLTNVACLGCCSLAPAMMIDGRVYGNLDNVTVGKVIDDLKNYELRITNDELRSEKGGNNQ